MTVALVLIAIPNIAIIAKNITYTTRFTPPSTELQLKNSTFYTQAQILILVLTSLLIIVLPFLAYCIFAKSKRFFFPLWIAFMVIVSLLLIINVYFLTGSQNYKDYLS